MLAKLKKEHKPRKWFKLLSIEFIKGFILSFKNNESAHFSIFFILILIDRPLWFMFSTLFIFSLRPVYLLIFETFIIEIKFLRLAYLPSSGF